MRTIVSTSGDLSSLKTQLRTYLEEAIYNYATLSDVVKGQKAIGLIMKRISLQAKDFAELLRWKNARDGYNGYEHLYSC